MPETTTRTEYAWEVTRIDGRREVIPAGEAGKSLDQMRAHLSSWGSDWHASIVKRTTVTTITDWTPVTEETP